MKLLTRGILSLLLAPLACLYAQLAAAQVKIQPSNFNEKVIVQPTDEIRLTLDRLPAEEEGKLTIFIGRTDVTSQFRLVGTELIYQPGLFPLPSGATQVTVYLVKDNQWQEIAQFPLSVAPQKQSDGLIQPNLPSESKQPDAATPAEQQQPPTVEPTDRQSTDPSQPPEQPEASLPDLDKPVTNGSNQPQPEPSQPTQKPAQEPPKKTTQSDSIPSKPSTSAADLSNSFQPQPPLQPQSPAPDPIQAQPETPSSDFTITFKPRMNVTVKSQFLEQTSGNAPPSERPTFTDATVEAGFEAEISRGTFNLQSRFSTLGVTFQPEALRFAELGENAPRFDLSEYQINAKWGPVEFAMGHLCYGNHPFLLSNVCSRGVTFKVNLSDRIDLSINSMNATSLVGFDNFFGLNDFSNNITAATLGFQLIKNDFGGIRLEATVMDGKRKPIGDFNVGEVVDAEKSRGFGFRLFGTDNSGRLRMDVGYARSTFTNPPDRQLIDAGAGVDELVADEFEEAPFIEEPFVGEPIIEQPILEQPIVEPPLDPPIDPLPVEQPIVEAPIVEAPIVEAPIVESPIPEEFIEETNGTPEIQIVPVKPVTKSAFYADVSYDVLKDVNLGGNRTLSLTLNGRYERIDPQFQSLGATVTADQMRTVVGFNASISGASIQFQQEWLEDNLANVPTILKTKTRNTTLNVNVPFQNVLGSTSRFLPVLNYSYQRVQQVGANVPIPDLSGFDPTEIPNQINQQHQFGVQWLFDELSLSYQFSSSFQDNRQPSRENADFLNLSHQLSFSWQPSPQFQLTLGYNWSSAESKEEGITRFNSSPTVGLSWEFLKNLTLALNYNFTSDRDSRNQSFTRAIGLEAILTWRFTIFSGSGTQFPGSAFIRYSRQSNLNRDNVFGFSTDSTLQVINAGLSISF